MPFLDFRLEPNHNLLKWLFLRGMSLVYVFLIRTWLMLYKTGIKNSRPAGEPVISVGNITLGGTGKTPMVDWLLTYLSEKNWTPSVLTRGYKAGKTEKLQILNRDTAASGNSEKFGDEPWLLFSHHPDISFYISSDRVESARQAAESSNVLVMDDGMQHLRLKRDLNIVLIDALSGLGNRHIFPLGPLREPLSSLDRADVIIYTKTNLVPSATIRGELKEYLPPDLKQFDSTYMPDKLIMASGPAQPVTALDRKKCLLFSGIGNPKGFSEVVKGTGAFIVEHLIFDDHMVYTEEALNKIRRLAGNRPHDYLLCTEKDWVKLADLQAELSTLSCLQMRMKIEPAFESFLTDWLAQNTGD